MAARFYRSLKVVAFNANGILRRRYKLNKQLKYLYIDVALLSEIHLKPHKRFFIPNYHFYRTDHFPGRIGIPHNHVDLCYMSDMCTWQRRRLFIREKRILSWENMLPEDYNRKSFSCKRKHESWISRGLAPERTLWQYTTSRTVTLIDSTVSRDLIVSRSHDIVIRLSKTDNDMRRRGHWWDPLPCNDWWGHGKLRRESGCCSNLLIVQINYSVVITCS
jgi:hypothetical protein